MDEESAQPGRVAKYDYAYERNRMANNFMFVDGFGSKSKASTPNERLLFL